MFGMDSGAYPLSEPESRTVVDTFSEHPHIGCAVTMHTYTGGILTQPYREETPLGDGDIDLMGLLAEDLVDGTGYDVYEVYPDFMYEEGRPIPGVWADTISTVFGVPGYTVEMWDPFGHVGVEIDNPASFFQDPDEETIREFLQGFAGEEAHVQPWRPVEHPQLGEVEVGGLEYLRTIRNPPVELLADECEKAWTIAERARRALPEVGAEVDLEPLGGETHRLRVVLENRGFLPTSGLQRGEAVAETPEVRVELEADEGLEITGPARRPLEHMDGWGNLRTGAGQHPSYATLQERGHRTWTDWRVTGEGTLVLRWIAGRGGRGRRTVQVTAEPEATSG